MPLAISDELLQLASVVRAFSERHGLAGQARASLADEENLPEFWKELGSVGWLGLHLPERYGGQGYGLEPTAVVLEELARAMAPGPVLPTVVASAVIAASGDGDVMDRWLPGFADGTLVAGLGFGRLVLGAGLAHVLLLADGEDLVVLPAHAADITPRPNLDPTRRVAEVDWDRHHGTRLRGARRHGLAVARALAAAEASGTAHACTEMATAYAKMRQQFGRVIGSFMAVKHHCANMRVQAELATAAAWDAARAAASGGATSEAELEFAAAVAAAVAFAAATFCAEVNIQVHGGIGYTWEHNAHLYMRRAGATTALFGSATAASEDVHRLATEGRGRRPTVELPPAAEIHRSDVRAFLHGFSGLPEVEQRRRLVDSGYLQPHWPKPWGRDADAVEQLVIDEEFAGAGVDRPDMGIGGWVTLTFTQRGTDEQRERWTRPSLLGETRWCQLFSEPNAGSDAAGVQTRGTKVEGGWLVNGQKLWTSGAQQCTHGFATVRTDPEAAKHSGVTVMAIDLQARGVTIRPLRSIAGHSGFNEVFFDDVFVPDGDVVGPVNGGWSVARATLGNERVTIGSGRVTARDVDEGILISLAADRHADDRGVAARVGALVAEGAAMKLINLRSVLRAVMGSEPTPEGSVTKLLNSEHGQRVAAMALELSGETGALGEEGGVGHRWVAVRSLSIAGGTSEIARNVIGERLLGLPREPGLR